MERYYDIDIDTNIDIDINLVLINNYPLHCYYTLFIEVCAIAVNYRERGPLALVCLSSRSKSKLACVNTAHIILADVNAHTT